jgi:hypothetical protein
MNIKMIAALTVASAIAAPAFAADYDSEQASAATTTQPAGMTRAQVRAELVQIEQAGYNPAHGEDVHYPDDIQAAEAKVAAQNQAAAGYGGVAGGVSAGGSPATAPTVATANTKSIYFGH